MMWEPTQRKRTQAALDDRHAAFFWEVKTIRALLLEDVHGRTRPEPLPRARDRLRGWPLLCFLAVEIVGWSAAVWGLNRNNDWITVLGVLVALLTVVVWSGMSVRQFRAEWQRRREDSLETATRAAQAHDELVAHLMVFSRASLNFVADEFRDREARVARRTGLVVGPAQAGGILGLIGLGIAATSTLNGAVLRRIAASLPVRAEDGETPTALTVHPLQTLSADHDSLGGLALQPQHLKVGQDEQDEQEPCWHTIKHSFFNYVISRIYAIIYV